jgi:hypothetical protein
VVLPDGTACDTLLISNLGDLELNWTIADTCDWLTADPTGGAVPPSGSQEVEVCVDATGLVPGAYACDLVIDSNDPDEPQVVVPVMLTVKGDPDIEIDPESFVFTLELGGSDCDTLFISNVGGGDLDWSIADTCDWLTSAPTSGIVPPDSTVAVEVCVDATGLPPAVYQCELTITSNDPDEPQVIVPVDMENDPTGIHDPTIPSRYALLGNYPNPFNPITSIRYDLPTPMRVTLKVYSISGRLIRTLIDGREQEPGAYSIRWDSRDERGRLASSGVYMCRLEADGEVLTRQMVLLK